MFKSTDYDNNNTYSCIFKPFDLARELFETHILPLSHNFIFM